jgi:hypothetical protein
VANEKRRRPTPKFAPEPVHDVRKEIVAKAVVDPDFRRKLFANPEEVFGGRLTKQDRAGLERLEMFLPALDDITSSLAGEVLGGGGGGCGGLA